MFLSPDSLFWYSLCSVSLNGWTDNDWAMAAVLSVDQGFLFSSNVGLYSDISESLYDSSDE